VGSIGSPPRRRADQLEKRKGTPQKGLRLMPMLATPSLPAISQHFTEVGSSGRCAISAFIFGAAARASRRWSTNPSIGSTGVFVGAAWPAKRLPRQPETWASSGAIPWPCCRSAATTWPTISATGWKWASASRIRPKSSTLNWFRRGPTKFLWPGYGENVRVLKWILERVEGRGAAEETPVGLVPARNALTLDGLQISPETMEELLSVNPEDWEDDLATASILRQIRQPLPRELREEHEKLSRRLSTKGASLARSG